MEELLDNTAKYIQSEQFIGDANSFLLKLAITVGVSLVVIALVSWTIIKKIENK